MKYVITENQVGKLSKNLNEDNQYTGSGFSDVLMKKLLKNAKFGKGVSDVRFEGVDLEEGFCIDIEFSYVFKYKEQLELAVKNHKKVQSMLTDAIKDTVEKLSIIVEMVDNPHDYKKCYTILEKVYFDSREDETPMNLTHTYFYDEY